MALYTIIKRKHTEDIFCCRTVFSYQCILIIKLYQYFDRIAIYYTLFPSLRTTRDAHLKGRIIVYTIFLILLYGRRLSTRTERR